MIVAGGTTLPSAIAPRLDFSAADLRGLARRSKDATHARRLLALALAAIYDGGTRSDETCARMGLGAALGRP